ncbi:MAG: tetratricopeptide repeat protein [Novosphingobium sp.]
MKFLRFLAIAVGLLAQVPVAHAGETPLAGPAPEWVVVAPEIDPQNLPRGNNTVPLFDEQYMMDGDLSVEYVDAAQLVSNAEQLQRLGTLKASWQPAHGDLTFHRLEILRGNERIDLLKDGPQLTVLRRETGLESQILDGTLTAFRQIDGLRIGDVLRFAFSVSRRDELLGGRAQSAMLLMPKPITIGFGRARMVWPASQDLRWKAMIEGIDAVPKKLPGNMRELVIDMPVAELPKIPKDAPVRFQPLPLLYASTFTGWNEVASVMAPLYGVDGTIAEGSDLAGVTDEIAAKHADPVERMAAALRTVQSDVRYLLVALGSGNYEPQAPVTTWERRYGDCKAKTLLLLAMLDRLGIEAEPVMASIGQGDRLPDMLPAAQAFDHVLVRAEIAGESFWLDGTGLGTRLADIRDVPRLGYVLPMRDEGSELVKLPLRADARPSPDVELTYDATAGIHLPVPFVLKVRYSGAYAEQSRENLGGANDDKLGEFAEQLSKTWTGSTTIIDPTVQYDPETASLTIAVEGLAYPDWEYRDGRLELSAEPILRVSFDPDRGRSAWRRLPALIEKPWTAHTSKTLVLPSEGEEATVEGMEPVSLSLPAVAYRRAVTRQGATIVEDIVSRETGAEVPGEDVSTTRKAIADANSTALRIAMPAAYPHRWDAVGSARNSRGLARIREVFDKRIAEKPDDATRLSDRAWLEERLLDWAAAEKLYGKAIALDPSSNLYMARSNVRAVLGKHEGALDDAQAAYDLDPGNEDVRGVLASALVEMNETDDALDLLDPSPDVASEDGEASLLSRADILMRGGRFEESIELLDAALNRRSTSPELLNSRCW